MGPYYLVPEGGGHTVVATWPASFGMQDNYTPVKAYSQGHTASKDNTADKGNQPEVVGGAGQGVCQTRRGSRRGNLTPTSELFSVGKMGHKLYNFFI